MEIKRGVQKSDKNNDDSFRIGAAPPHYYEGDIQVYPMLYKIAQVCATMPVSNGWLERGVSTLGRVKTCLRSQMKNYLLEAFMHVSTNGPAVSSKEGSKIIDRAVKR